MSLLQDSAISTAGCKQRKRRYSCHTTASKNVSLLSSLLKYGPIPPLSSIIARVGGELNNYGDGFGKEDWGKNLQTEVDKRVLHLRMRSVSCTDLHPLLFAAR